MTTLIVNLCLAILSGVLWIYNLISFREGTLRVGKIVRNLGPFGYTAVMFAIVAMAVSDLVAGGNTFLGRAAIVLNFIIALDNFLNGDDPHNYKRRAWIKNKFAKLARAKAG